MNDLQSETQKRIKTVALDRRQLSWEVVDLDLLIEADHPARAIWELSGGFNLSRFEQHSKTIEGNAGRPCWPARLLVSVWVYSYTLGVASARAMERMMSHEPGLRWLMAGHTINHHTLSGFRVGHKEALGELFAQFLTMLQAAELVDLSTLLHDGTKVRAVAGKASMHRRETLEKGLKQARAVVEELDRRAEAAGDGEAGDSGKGMDERRRAAKQRAAREALQRAEAALEKLKKLEVGAAPKEIGKLRVSDTESEARKMKHPDGGWAPSYNVQVTTEVKSRIVVGIGISTDANDLHELLPALERAKQTCGAKPARIIADNGYATRENVENTSKTEVQLIAPWKEDASREAGACGRNGIDTAFTASAFAIVNNGLQLICPEGKTLPRTAEKKQHGLPTRIYTADAAGCESCPSKQKCCGMKGAPRSVSRVLESEAMQQYLARMKEPETQKLYAKRSEIAEFPHLWAKGVKKWTRFSVRGKVKAGMEAMWVALAYNVAQWMRLRNQQPATA